MVRVLWSHTGRIKVPTRVGDPLRAVHAVNRVVAGAGQPAILWGDVEERRVQMDVGRTGRGFRDCIWARKKWDKMVWLGGRH